MNKEYQPTVAYLGPEASFTHVAADFLFNDVQLMPQPTIPDAIEAVSAGKVDYAIVPLENALEGSVPLTIDYLFHESDLFINAELSIPIEQHLMVHPENTTEELLSIHSHPHALAQCHKYLMYEYRRVPLIQTTSTAAAAKFVSENPKQFIAAIGNRLAAKKYGLTILQDNIHDFHFNHTRFIVLSKQKKELVVTHRQHTDQPKTTLMIRWSEEDRSGKLHKVLSVFAWRGLNLSKIESRPLKTGLGNYFFIIDVLQAEDHAMMQGALQELTALNCTVRSFGTYYSYEQLSDRMQRLS